MELRTKWLLSKKKSCSCTMPGVWRAVSFCEGCAVIFHSPRGCVHVASSMDISAQYRAFAEGSREGCDGVPLVSSDLREKDSIFGGIGRLHQCIRYVMDVYKPQCLVIATSCVAGVIGDDVESEAAEAEGEYGAPVMCVPFGGFLGGEYSDGYYKTANMAAERFFKKQNHVPKRVLLLGDQMGPWGQYATEVKRILSFFGAEATYQFPGYVPFAQWEEIPSASLSVILGSGERSEGLVRLARRLEKEWRVPCLGEIYPVGWEDTRRWTEALSDFFGEPDVGAAVIRKEEERIDAYVRKMRHVTKGKKAVIGIGRGSKWYDPSDTIRTLQRMDTDIIGIVLLDNLDDRDRDIYIKRCKALSDAPIFRGNDGVKVIEEADVLLTTNEITTVDTKQFFIPMIPLAGSGGEISLIRSLSRLLCRYGNKGGIAYATL